MIVIDRFEGNFAVCEMDGQMVNIPRSCIPPQAGEGSALQLVPADDAAARQRIIEKQNHLFK